VPLLTMSFSFMLTDKRDMLAPQTASIATLRELARTGEKILVRYGPSEQGMWRITEASMSSELREPDENEITRATVSIKLTQASDAAPAIGPLGKPAPPPPAPSKPPPPRVHIVVKGDCLWSIARRYYGSNSGPSWPRIFDANRKLIKNPHLIFPGQRFVIP
jgi:nucleoid-associated protein YgaU